MAVTESESRAPCIQKEECGSLQVEGRGRAFQMESVGPKPYTQQLLSYSWPAAGWCEVQYAFGKPYPR